MAKRGPFRSRDGSSVATVHLGPATLGCVIAFALVAGRVATAAPGDLGDAYIAHFWGPSIEQYDPQTQQHEHSYFGAIGGDQGGAVHWLHRSDKLLMTHMTTDKVHWSNPDGTRAGIAVRRPHVDGPMDAALGPHGRLLVANRASRSVSAHVWNHRAVDPAVSSTLIGDWRVPTRGYPLALLECDGHAGLGASCPGAVDVLVAVQGSSRDILGLDVDTGSWTIIVQDLFWEDGPLDMAWHPTRSDRVLVGTRFNGLRELDLDTGVLLTLVNGTDVFGKVGDGGSGKDIGAVEGVAVNPWQGPDGTIILSDRCDGCLAQNRLMNFDPNGTFLGEYAIGDFSGDLAVRLPEPGATIWFAAALVLAMRQRRPWHARVVQ